MWGKDLLILALISGIWFCGLLGFRPYANPDEGRYTEIPREMAASGDFVTPRLNGVKYFEKPPLMYWLSALTFKAFGLNPFTARLWCALFAILGVLLTYTTARCLHGREAGIASAVVLGTSLLYYVLGQIIILDMAVAVSLSGTLFAFILAMREPAGRKRLAWFLTFYTFMALATLTKGLIGILLPGAVIFLWVLLLNRWRALWPFYPILGTLLLLAITAPWHVLAALANHSDIKEHDFTWFYFIHEHFLRFTTQIHKRYEPWWFFLPVLIAGLFPWTFFAWQALRQALTGGWKARTRNPETWFFVIWIAFVMVFFSKSQSKLVPYILPVFPAAAVLLGKYVRDLWRAPAGTHARGPAWGFGAFLILLIAALFAAKVPKDQAEFAAHLPNLRLILCPALVIGSGAAIIAARRRDPKLLLVTMAATFGFFLMNLNWFYQYIDKSSSRDISLCLKARLKPDDRVYVIDQYPQDMPVYLERVVSVVNYTGELEFGINAEPCDTQSRFLTRQGFLEQWAQPGTAYACLRRGAYNKWFKAAAGPHEVITHTDRLVLVAKRP